jgi:hypothetical protein
MLLRRRRRGCLCSIRSCAWGDGNKLGGSVGSERWNTFPSPVCKRLQNQSELVGIVHRPTSANSRRHHAKAPRDGAQHQFDGPQAGHVVAAVN